MYRVFSSARQIYVITSPGSDSSSTPNLGLGSNTGESEKIYCEHKLVSKIQKLAEYRLAKDQKYESIVY